MSERLPSPEYQEPQRRRPNEAQAAKLQALCDAYRVEYNPDHYFVYPPESMMVAGYAEGWIGGQPGTLYVGVSPEGHANS